MPEGFFSVLPCYFDNGPKCEYLSDAAHAFLGIGEYFKSVKSASIDSVIEHLSDEGLIRLENTAQSLRSARTFVFAVLGWQTMLYRASIGTCPPEQLAVIEEQNGFRGNAFLQLKQEERSCSKPNLPEFLVGFGVLLPAKNLCLTKSTHERQAFDKLDKIMPASFNAAVLSFVGHVHVKWVDTLSCHLEFDPVARELYLFRFPTFCQASLDCAGSQYTRKSVIHSCGATSGHHLHEWALPEEIDSFLSEILLSYRLLFGQTKASRKFFRKTAPFEDVPKDVEDALLARLCGKETCYSRGRKADRDIYELSEDFPILRSRIAALHSHLERTKPRTWTELWRDKRDSAQWLTFWAVICFGGLGLLFAFLQVVLQAAQLALSL